MLDITVIILTYNEEIHIRRCVEQAIRFAKKVFVVDCYSTDATRSISESLGAEVVNHAWPGNQAEQFNWAIDHLPIHTEWILRLDADEYLLPELVDELYDTLPTLSEQVSALSLPRSRAFCGRILHHGIVKSVRIIRIFRKGKARYEKRLMDEHLTVLEGNVIEMAHSFIDDNRMSIHQFITKHNDYASREAALLLDAELNLTQTNDVIQKFGREVAVKREQKERYARLPLFWRAFGYFIYRYIIKLGFLDGKEGFLWDFMQGWWYRTLVDAKVEEVKNACGHDREKIVRYLKTQYGVNL